MKKDIQEVHVRLGDRSYPILIGTDLWEALAEQMAAILKPRRVVVISDTQVGPLYEGFLDKVFSQRNWKTSFHRMPAGEENKNLGSLNRLYQEILDAGCDRRTPVVALGGGVPGDTAGFAAATLLRGLPLVQVPTTLLAMVDSSVGGKTGVDMPQGKNLVGAFHQPALVVISIDTLDTLPVREIRAGMAEVIKYGIIRDEAFFRSLEQDRVDAGDLQPDRLQRIIARCCEIKAEVVSQDERESGLREILNFGHTVGHAIEAATAYGAYLHGEAVSIGMVVECAIAHHKNLVSDRVLDELRDLLSRNQLPVRVPDISTDRIWTLMHADKKAREGKIRMVLPDRIGSVKTVEGLEQIDLEKAWQACKVD